MITRKEIILYMKIMSYQYISLLPLLIFSLVHFYAQGLKNLSLSTQSRFLSMGGGVAIAYVFIDLLPKIGENDAIVKMLIGGAFPFLERHAYIMALCGFLLFFSVDRLQKYIGPTRVFYLSISSYAFFNFLVGYAIVDPNDPEVQPLALFTFAMALHYFTNDFSLSQSHGKDYGNKEKWILIISLFLGWLTGFFLILPTLAIALISAFIGGGVIMNVIRHELPERNPNSLSAFLLASFFYTVILLTIGKKG